MWWLFANASTHLARSYDYNQREKKRLPLEQSLDHHEWYWNGWLDRIFHLCTNSSVLVLFRRHCKYYFRCSCHSQRTTQSSMYDYVSMQGQRRLLISSSLMFHLIYLYSNCNCKRWWSIVKRNYFVSTQSPTLNYKLEKCSKE